ncbi:MAG: hypothetical protein QOH93_2148 [Chloroflexia bacterium]|jgi:hypothetical protein|nr:hypothetical protein [Chloroflexia bacterium]
MRNGLIVEFRWLYVVNLLIAVTFGVLLFVLPGAVDIYGPWVIPNAHSAYLVGAAYVGAPIYYAAALRRNSWPIARNGVGGLIFFSLALLVATMFHWDRFRPYVPTTLLWLVLYYLPPVGYPILSRVQMARNGNDRAPGVDISTPWRYWLIARGGLYAALAVLGLLFAPSIVPDWPWPITPLEVRVFMGQLAINAWGGAIVLLGDLRWQHNRLGLALTGTVGAAQLLGLLLGGGPYNWSSPLGILLPLMFLEWVATTVLMFSVYRNR